MSEKTRIVIDFPTEEAAELWLYNLIDDGFLPGEVDAFPFDSLDQKSIAIKNTWIVRRDTERMNGLLEENK